MQEMYNIIKSLCEDKGISIGKMCKEVGIRDSVISDLKNGRSKTLSTSTLDKLSFYFHAPIDVFLRPGEPDPRDIPPEPPITDDQLMFALWGDVKDELTEEDLMEVRRYAEFVRHRKLDNKKGE